MIGGSNLTLGMNIFYLFFFLYLESFEMWCLKRLEKISWTDCVKNEEVLQRVKEEN